MENELERNSSPVSEEVEQMTVAEEAKITLLSMSKWVKFLAILGFIAIGFLVINGIVILVNGVGGRLTQVNPYLSFLGSSLGLIYFALASLILYPNLKLLSFSRKAKLAVLSNDEMALTGALQDMRSYWKFMGILAIIYIAIVVIVFLVGIIVATASFAH